MCLNPSISYILGCFQTSLFTIVSKIHKLNICSERCSHLQIGDYVFAKIVIPKGFDFYVPAIVIALPNQDMADDKFYTVLKCNNRRVSRLSLEKHLFFRQKVASLTPAFLGCSAWLSPALAVSISPAHPAPVVRVPSTGRLEVRPC